MKLTLRLKILLMVGIITLSSLLGHVMLTHNAHVMGNSLRFETEAHIKALVGKNAKKIESAMLIMERNAEDLATAGEAFYAIHKATGEDITKQITEYLIANFKKMPKAIGGGLWYEPYALFEEKKRFGPYVYRQDGQVFFTWDLNTETYDYHRKGWYLLAIPPDWDRSRPRSSGIYWTDPYTDEAATKSLMITVDAVMYDARGKIIGISTVDFGLEDLKEMVSEMMITAHALPFAADVSSGLLISFPADSSKILKNIGDLGVENLAEAVRKARPMDVVAKPVTLEGEPFFLCYTVSSTGTVLGIMAPFDELHAHIHDLNRANMVTSFLIISIQVVLYLVIAFFMIRRICNPINRLTDVAQEIAAGNLAGASKSLAVLGPRSGKKGDETGRLLAAFEGMNRDLADLLAQVQRSGIQVTSSSTELAATAKEQETTMANQVASTERMAASVEQISRVAGQLVETMEQVAFKSQETAGFAAKGQSDLSRMESAMRTMESASRSISGRLETINEKAENITDVVTTITKVADQTNLLSLNAAIEAEKAGEYGRGFNVVAREIRRLADQTAVATLDIDQMVQEMQSAVSAGVMEMDKFIAEVNRSVEDVGRISGQLARIIEQVQALSPEFENVNVAMGRQSENAQKINESMARLSEEMKETMDSLRETYAAIEQLNEAARGLQEEVSKFKLRAACPWTLKESEQ